MNKHDNMILLFLKHDIYLCLYLNDYMRKSTCLVFAILNDLSILRKLNFVVKILGFSFSLMCEKKYSVVAVHYRSAVHSACVRARACMQPR